MAFYLEGRRCRRNVPPKRRFIQDLHGATSQKTTFFTVTAVKTSNLTKEFIFGFGVLTAVTVDIAACSLVKSTKVSEKHVFIFRVEE
jgi:hypothetical protein